MANDLRWNPVSVNFNDSAAFMNSAGNSFSRAGTVFGELRKQILDQEQKRIENEYKERALQQTIDAENRLNEYRLMTAQEAERHNKATEAYYRGMLDYHNRHADITQQLGESRNRLLAEQLKFRGEHSDKTRIVGGKFALTDLFPAMSESDALEAKPSATALAPTDLNERLKKYRALSEQYENIDDPTDEQTAAFYREVGRLGLTPEVINKSATPSTDIVTKGNPVDDLGINEGLKFGIPDELGINNPNGNDSSTNTTKASTPLDSSDTWYNAFRKDYVGEGLFSKNRADPTTFKERVAAGMQRTMSPLRPIADAARLLLDEPAEPKKEPLTVVYGNNLVEDAQGFYTNVDNFYKAIEKNKISNSNFDDFSHLNGYESEAMRRYGNSNNAVRNFGDNWFANTFFGSADTMVLSASATENKAQHELRATKELAALKQIYSSGDTDLQNFVLARLKQGAKSRNTEVAAKCKAGYKYLSSAINDTEYGTSVGGLQALDNMYLNLRFPTKENASSITAYQEKRTEKTKTQMEADKRLTRLMQDPLDFTKFGGNKQNLANAEYKKLREVVNAANHTDIPEDWQYGKTNRLARAAALQLTLNQLRTKDKLFFGNVVDANDRFFDVLQHAGNLKFFDKDTTEGSLFHEYYRAMYQMNPSEIKEFMQNIHSSNNQSSK